MRLPPTEKTSEPDATNAPAMETSPVTVKSLPASTREAPCWTVSVAAAVLAALKSKGYNAETLEFSPRNFFADMQRLRPDIVFNAMHGAGPASAFT